MRNIIAGTLTFIIVTFVIQSTSHFFIYVDHYSAVTFTRTEVIFPLGFLTMTLQGIVLTYFFEIYCKGKYTMLKGLKYGLLMSVLFVSYPAFTEPAKYQVPNLGSWILVEGSVGVIQFCLFGILVSLIFSKIAAKG